MAISVSVVIPTYNAPALLLETLDSVFAQTHADFEAVVVNDGSTDDTAARLMAYAGERSERIGGRLRVVTQENRGIGAARNRGVAEARGKYVALLDHDDLWKPEKLAAQVEFMESHRQCAACSVPWAYLARPRECAFDLATVCGVDGVVRRPLQLLAHGRLFLISSSICFDRERCAGLRYETRPKCIEDTPFQIGLFGRGEFGIAGGSIQMLYRQHAANYSSQAEFFSNGIRLLRELDAAGRFGELSPTDRGDLRLFLAHLGRTAAARQLLAGTRTDAMATYVSEAGWQLSVGAWRFLLCFPILTVLPLPIVRTLIGGELKQQSALE